MNKEEWIQYISGTASEIKKAEPNPYLFTRITERLNQKSQIAQSSVKTSVALRWAFISCLVLTLNIFVMTLKTNHQKQVKQQFNLEALSSEMGLNSTYNY